MFDVAAIFSDEEYFLKYGENVCVQSVVEKPSLYTIGRCPSTDRQLLYSDIRIEDIPLLRENLETSDDIPIRDKLRMFKRDSSTHLFEAGQQKGGFFFSLLAVFKESSRQIFDIHYCLSLQDCINKVIETESTFYRIQRGDVKLFRKLKNDEIIDVLLRFPCKLNGDFHELKFL